VNADTIQAKYDQLTVISTRFRDQAEQCTDVQRRMQRGFQQLQNGGWEGRGAAAFFSEMEREIFPAMRRLHVALTTGAEVVRQISEILRAAEEEAARLFGSGAGALAGGPTTSASGNGAATSQAITPVPTVPTKEIFSDAYLDRLVGLRFQGAGSAQLRQAMDTLAGHPSPAEVDRALNQIAAARGLSRDQVQANYNRYLELRAEAERIGAANRQGPVESVNKLFHGDFMGTTSQLRYGKVVGDALGVDPVFAALLNPTGGLVGPGNAAVDLGDSALSYHGAVHDAAGYLYNYHDMGPGYNYLGLESRDTSNPLTGQQAGIRYWNEKFGTGKIESVVTETTGTALGEVEDAVTWYEETRETVKQRWNDVRDWFSNTFDF